MVNEPGKHNFKFEVYPMTVKGLDHSSDFCFEVKSESEDRKKVIKSIEERDNKLQIKPSLFQNMISTIMPVNPEDEEEEEEDENTKDNNKEEEKKENYNVGNKKKSPKKHKNNDNFDSKDNNEDEEEKLERPFVEN